MSSTIFLVDQDNKLTELTRSEYASEELLQDLLATHPSLLGSTSGDQLLLIKREFGVPEDRDRGDRWSLDHLFLDRSGVPILVEVKRSSDTRARREVVAQMLDYAANGVAYWSLDRIVSAFRESAGPTELDSDALLANFLGEEDPEMFWRQVEANLRSGRIRMVFVADKIAKELRRIVEFLNEQMRPAEVLAIEVEQFVSPNGMRTLVPRLLGDTERAQAAKSVASEISSMTEQEWIDALAESKGVGASQITRKLIAWFRSAGFEVGVSNSNDSMFAGLVRPDGKLVFPFFIRMSTGRLDTSLQNLRYGPAFAAEGSRLKLLKELRAVTPKLVSTEKLTGWPAIPLGDLEQAEVWKRFCEVASFVKQRVESGLPAVVEEEE